MLTMCSDLCQMPMDSAGAAACAQQKRRGEQEMAALYAIGQALAERSRPRETLQEILEVLERELQMVRGTVMLLTPDGEHLDVAAVRNIDLNAAQSVRYRLGEGITGQVVATGQSVALPSVANEPRFCDRLHARLGGEVEDVSFVCVPILVENRAVGTLAVDLPVEHRMWLDQAERLLVIVAAMIGYDVRARRIEQEERAVFEAENLRLRNELEERFRPETIIGNSRAMRAIYLKIQQVAATDTTVLIRGESGTGKELVASAIHYSSPRARNPFVKVNCAALSEALLESELFGHEKGAFTGAVQQRIGRIEEAEGGTLFLDEIGDFSPAVQVKLLRVLQEREYERVGSNRTIRANVRIIAATNRNLESAVHDRSFRHDLYYRINVFPVHLPALRERRDDILQLANHFARRYGEKMSKDIHRISTPAINTMLAYHWPGNVRELENCIEHAVLLSHDGVIHSHHLPPTLNMPNADDHETLGPLEVRVSALERDMISDALKRTQGNMAAAARELGLTPRVIRYKIKNLGIDYETMFRHSH